MNLPVVLRVPSFEGLKRTIRGSVYFGFKATRVAILGCVHATSGSLRLEEGKTYYLTLEGWTVIQDKRGRPDVYQGERRVQVDLLTAVRAGFLEPQLPGLKYWMTRGMEPIQAPKPSAFVTAAKRWEADRKNAEKFPQPKPTPFVPHSADDWAKFEADLAETAEACGHPPEDAEKILAEMWVDPSAEKWAEMTKRGQTC